MLTLADMRLFSVIRPASAEPTINKTITVMTKLSNSAPARGGQPYESPALEIIDIEIEGTVCVDSYNLGSAGYGGGDNDMGEI